MNQGPSTVSAGLDFNWQAMEPLVTVSVQIFQRDSEAAISTTAGILTNTTSCVDTDVIQVVKWTSPSPSVFTYCKRSKTGWWEALGTGYSTSCVV